MSAPQEGWVIASWQRHLLGLILDLGVIALVTGVVGEQRFWGTGGVSGEG